MVKVHCDPAQVIVNHASFRVQLPRSPRPVRGLADTARLASVGAGAAGAAGLAGAAGRSARRRAPVVWSGRSAPGDSGATGLLQAVRNSTTETPAPSVQDPYSTGATQVIPRVDLGGDTVLHPAVTDTGGLRRDKPLLPPMRQAVGAYDTPAYGSEGAGRDTGAYDLEPPPAGDRGRPGPSHRAGGDHTRHAYYPDRRVNLGVVLLPLRILLGLISVYAGMGKLCDPVYFDGGERGSMVRWLGSLEPWALAEPMRDFALAHPVGSGLTVAFLQVIVGVLTLLGLWQRVAAVVGALLSAALILTVSWRTVPVYDAPDIIFLAAWSPLIIAGAPVYSVDGRLSGEAWRTLGPRSDLWDLRRRVLRRGGLLAGVVVGLTMLIGSMLGGAVRSTQVVTVPGPGQAPTNHLPGAPLPQESGTDRGPAQRKNTPTPAATRSATPESRTSAPAQGTVRETAGASSGAPSQTQGTGGGQPVTGSRPAPPPATSSGPAADSGTGSGGTGSGAPSGDGPGGSGGDEGSSSGGSGGGSGGGKVIGGLLG
ncbi:DoxX family membrane protein [Streptomyces sp. NPDC005805]|uniref:DoxX family protein n=1 Tax=Streptomyces sp. NPDC005805 TaxID=3157068 RepID=UPI0033D765F6